MNAAALFFLLVSVYMTWTSFAATELPVSRLMAAAATLAAAIAIHWQYRKSRKPAG